MSESQRQVSSFSFPLDSLVQLRSKPPSLWRVAAQRATYRWLKEASLEYGIINPHNDYADILWVGAKELAPATLAQEEILRG